jgi:hypothetical protein
MGEARRRGTAEERMRQAIKRNKADLVEHLGARDYELDERLRAGLTPFLARLGMNAWATRRAAIVDALQNVDEGTRLETARPVRVMQDEIGWYLFLVEQTLDDPLCNEVAQAQRVLPYFAGIGSRWQYAENIHGLGEKLDEILHTYKAAPDGGIFELSVALAYASKGWDVEFIPTRRGEGMKTPDMVVRKDGLEINIECKRQERRGAYAEDERKHFLRLWDATEPVLSANGQWIWMRAVFHAELTTLPSTFLANLISSALPLRSREAVLYDGPELTLAARQIDIRAVQAHFHEHRVKVGSPMYRSVIGGDWAEKNAAVTMSQVAQASELVGSEVPVLGRFIEEVAWVCGMTREVDADAAVDKKARDIKNLLAKAVQQLPENGWSIVHIAAETLEGPEVEHRRSAKVMASMEGFVSNKPVLAVRFHRFQSNSVVDQLFEFDETVDTYKAGDVPLEEIPLGVVTPEENKMRKGSHWELYPGSSIVKAHSR